MPGLDILNPITSVITAVSGIIDKFVPNPEQKAAAALELTKVQTDAALKAAALEQQFAEAQAGVVTAEVKSDSWLTRNWRPILMLVFTYIVFHNFVLLPVFRVPPVAIPDEMWSLLKLGIGGYIGARTIEKGVATVANSLGGKP